MSDKIWKKQASSLIKTELAKKDIGYDELSELLGKVDAFDSAGNIASKLSRGTFSFVFALQVFKALGLKNLRLED